MIHRNVSLQINSTTGQTTQFSGARRGMFAIRELNGERHNGQGQHVWWTAIVSASRIWHTTTMEIIIIIHNSEDNDRHHSCVAPLDTLFKLYHMECISYVSRLISFFEFWPAHIFSHFIVFSLFSRYIYHSPPSLPQRLTVFSFICSFQSRYLHQIDCRCSFPWAKLKWIFFMRKSKQQ